MSTTITVRIPLELKEEVKRYRIRVSEVVRRALEEEVERRRMEEARRAAGELGDFLSKIPEEEIIRSVKEARRARLLYLFDSSAIAILLRGFREKGRLS